MANDESVTPALTLELIVRQPNERICLIMQLNFHFSFQFSLNFFRSFFFDISFLLGVALLLDYCFYFSIFDWMTRWTSFCDYDRQFNVFFVRLNDALVSVFHNVELKNIALNFSLDVLCCISLEYNQIFITSRANMFSNTMIQSQLK